MTYNMSAFENSNNILDQALAINQLSTVNGVPVFATVLMISLFVIILIALLRRNEIPESLFGAAGSCMAIATMLWVIGLVNVLYILGFAIVAGVAAVAMYQQTT